MDSDTKGRYFEEKCAIYMRRVHPDYAVYKFSDCPRSVIERLNLYAAEDTGVDLVMVSPDGRLHTVQAKWRSSGNVSYADISTFLSHTTNVSTLTLMVNFPKLKRSTRVKVSKHNLRIVTGIMFRSINIPVETEDDLADFSQPVLPMYELRPYQREAVMRVSDFFEENARGRLVMACGTGKTFVSLKICEELGADRVVVVVPSMYLVNQFYERFQTQSVGYDYLLISSGNSRQVDETLAVMTTDPDTITGRMRRRGRLVVIVTHASVTRVFVKCARDAGWVADLAVFDEAHKLAKIPPRGGSGVQDAADSVEARRKLFMTATERYMDGARGYVDMTAQSSDRIFGPVIWNYTMRHAILNHDLVDYSVLYQFDLDDSAPSALRDRAGDYSRSRANISAAIIERQVELGRVTHVLTYHRNTRNMNMFVKIFTRRAKVSRVTSPMYVASITGNTPVDRRRDILDKFTESPTGLIASMNVFNEGVDIPVVDAICFVDRRLSTINIIQSIGRALRTYTSPDGSVKAGALVIIPVRATRAVKEWGNVCRYAYRKDSEFLVKITESFLHYDHAGVTTAAESQKDRQSGPAWDREEGKRDMILADVKGPSVPADVVGEILAHIRVDILQSITASSTSWEESFAELKEFVGRTGRMPSADEDGERGMRKWADSQTRNAELDRLSVDEFKMLSDVIDWDSDEIENAWDRFLFDMVEYVDARGVYPSGEATELSEWVNIQRVKHQTGVMQNNRIAEYETARLHCEGSIRWHSNRRRFSRGKRAPEIDRWLAESAAAAAAGSLTAPVDGLSEPQLRVWKNALYRACIAEPYARGTACRAPGPAVAAMVAKVGAALELDPDALSDPDAAVFDAPAAARRMTKAVVAGTLLAQSMQSGRASPDCLRAVPYLMPVLVGRARDTPLLSSLRDALGRGALRRLRSACSRVDAYMVAALRLSGARLGSARVAELVSAVLTGAEIVL